MCLHTLCLQILARNASQEAQPTAACHWTRMAAVLSFAHQAGIAAKAKLNGLQRAKRLPMLTAQAPIAALQVIAHTSVHTHVHQTHTRTHAQTHTNNRTRTLLHS